MEVLSAMYNQVKVLSGNVEISTGNVRNGAIPGSIRVRPGREEGMANQVAQFPLLPETQLKMKMGSI